MSPDYATREEVVELGGKIDRLGDQVSGLARGLEKVEPLLLSASGYREILETIRRDLAASHTKHRDHYQRISDLREALQVQRDNNRLAIEDVEAGLLGRLERMERRQIKLGSAFLGALAVLQLVAPSIAEALGGVISAIGVGP